MDASGTKTKRALEGLKVVEWARFVAGPYCGKLLADLGAEVIKVEPPGTGDDARRQGPFPDDVPHAERSALFLYLNTNKKGITLDPAREEGADVLRRLLAQADVLIEDNPPSLPASLGLGFEALARRNPRLVMTSITPFGQSGPYRDYKSYYLNTFHGSGFGYLTPSDPHDPAITSREPIMMGGYLAEYYCGVMAGIATLSALNLDSGQHIDVSKQEAILQCLKTNVPQYFVDGEVPRRRPTSISPSSWGGIMPCRDGYVYMMGAESHQVQAVFDLMGNPEWSQDAKFRPEVFHLHSLEMRPHVLAWAAPRTRDEVWHGGQQRRAPISAIQNIEDVATSEHFKAREFFVDVEHPEAGRLGYPAAPARFSRTPIVMQGPAPLLGQHNEEVICGRLGYSRGELAALRRAGAV